MHKLAAFSLAMFFVLSSAAASQGIKLPFEWLQENGKNVGCAVEQGGTTTESRDIAECERALQTLTAHYAPKRVVSQEPAPSSGLTVTDSVRIITGAAIGGAIGHQFGKGRGKKAATAAGAIVGGALVYQGVQAEREEEYVDRRYAPSYRERQYHQYHDGYPDGYRRAVVVQRPAYRYGHGSGSFYGDDPCGGRLSHANCARWQDDIKKHELHRDLVQEQNYRETQRGW